MDNFQLIPRFVFDGVVEEKQRVIADLGVKIKENDELKEEILRLHKIIVTRKLVEMSNKIL